MRVSPSTYRKIALAALLALGTIVVTGAAVRLTNSGLGCDDWPRCSSTRLIDVSTRHAAIEQINRLFTGVVGVATIAAVVASWWRRPRRTDLIVWSWMLVVGVLANAVLGGISVMVDLHPIAIQGHMLLSMFLIVAATVLLRRSSEPDDVPRAPTVDSVTRLRVQVLFVMTWVAVITGTVVTGAGPHAGDENAARLDIAISTAARVHSLTVWVAVAIAVVLLWRVQHHSEANAVKPSLLRWVVLAALQSVIGYVQYFSGVPALLVGFHVLGATVLMWATTELLLDTSTATSLESSTQDSHV